MVPELSRSADHLCQQKINEEADEDGDYFKGNSLKTPDYSTHGITPSASMIASPGVSQWTVNESTTQTEGFWHDRGDSFDSSKSYSLRSGHSTNNLNKHRSRSVPSIRCAICKQNHHSMKPSESMHYATRTVTFQGKLFHQDPDICRDKIFVFQNRRKKTVARCQTCVMIVLVLDAMRAAERRFIECMSRVDPRRVWLKRLKSLCVIVMTKLWKQRQSQIDDVLRLTSSEVSLKSDENDLNT